MTVRTWSVATLRKHERIALDANVLIYLLEAAERRGSLAAAVLDEVTAGPARGSIATIATTEALTGVARSDDAAAFERTADALRDLDLDQVPLTAELAVDAAWLRGRTGLRLADAIHLASARAAKATAFVTNDRRIRSDDGLTVLYLDDLEVAGPTISGAGAADEPRGST